MKTAPSTLIQRLISAILIFQLSTSAALLQIARADGAETGPGPASSDVAASQLPADLQQSLESVERALDGAATAPLSFDDGDPFGFRKQIIELYDDDGKVTTYDLDEPGVNPPLIIPSDFLREVSFSIDPRTRSLSLDYRPDGKLRARHVFNGYEALAFARDKELLVMVDQKGKVRAFDSAYARNDGFRRKLPFFDLVQLDTDVTGLPALRAEFLRADLDPVALRAARATAELAPLDTDLTAGDFLLASGTERREVAILDRDLIHQTVARGEDLLRVVAYAQAPALDDGKLQAEIAAILAESDARAEASELMRTMDPSLLSYLNAMPASSHAALKERAERNREAQGERRHRFKASELLASQAEAVAQVKADEAQVRQSTLERIGQAIKDYGPTKNAAILTAASSYYWVPGLAHLARAYIPEVWYHTAYRFTDMKSTVALWMLAPLTGAIGYFAVGRKLSEGGTISRTMVGFVKSGMRIYAEVARPYLHRVAALFGQKNALLSMQSGLGVANRIRPESAVGQRLGLSATKIAGLTVPFAGNESVKQGQVAIDHLRRERQQARSLAYALSVMAVSAKYGVDPSTLAVLLEKGQYARVNLDVLDQSPEFQEHHAQVAAELYQELLSESRAGTPLDEPTLEAMDRFSAEAARIAERVVAGTAPPVLRRLKLAYRASIERTERALKAVAGLGAEEYEFFRAVMPTLDTAGQVTKNFAVDYPSGVLQMNWWGDRANWSDPSALAARDTWYSLYTNPAHLSDTVDGVRIYWFSSSALTTLLYQRKNVIKETAYAPLEYERLKGVVESESLIRGTARLMYHNLNLRASNVGEIYWQDFVNRLKVNLQMTASMIVLTRVLIGHQHLGPALAVAYYYIVWALWGYAWPWDIVNRGTQNMKKAMRGKEAALDQAKADLGEGLRLGELDTIARGVKKAVALYTEGAQTDVDLVTAKVAKRELPADIREAFAGVDSLINLPEEKLRALSQELVRDDDSALALQAALRSGQASRIDQAAQDMIARYGEQAGTAAKLQGHAAELLAYVMKNPPFAFRANSLAPWINVIIGAVSTNALAVKMSVVSFQPHDWLKSDLKATALSLALYGATFWGQRALNRSPDWWAKFKELVPAESCEGMLLP